MCASLAYATPALAADETAAPVVAQADVAQANPFADVPQNSWAYDAVRQLAAAGLITGYPDNSFKGNRPMTRYEMAVLINRAVNAMQSKIAQGVPGTAKQADLDALKRLVDGFGPELRQVRDALAALTTRTNALTTQTNALAAAQTALKAQDDALKAQVTKDEAVLGSLATTLAQQKVGVAFAQRPGVFNQVVGISQPAGVTAVALPAGGVWGGTSGSPTVFATTQGNGAAVNGVTGGMYDTNFVRLNMSGNFDGRIQYLARLENVFKPMGVNGNQASTPGYCAATSSVAVTANYSCQVADVSGTGLGGTTLANLPVRLAQAWLGYFAPSGFFAQIGRIGYDIGRLESGVSNAAASFNGVKIGYRDSRVQTYVSAASSGTVSSNRAILNGNSTINGTGAVFQNGQVCPIGNPAGSAAVVAAQSAIAGNTGTLLPPAIAPATPCFKQGSSTIVLLGEYYFPSTRTAIGSQYNGSAGQIYTGFNPWAGLCGTSTGAAGANPTVVAAGGGAAVVGAGAASGSVWNTAVTPAGGTAYCPAGTLPIVSAAGGTPVTGAYQTVQSNVNTLNAYVIQYAGPWDKPTFRFSAEYFVRLGNDPFSRASPTGVLTAFPDNKSLYLNAAYASKGNGITNALGPLYPGSGLKNSNVVELNYLNAGLNTFLGDQGIASGSVIPGINGFSYSGSNMVLLQIDHWFSNNFRAGVYAQYSGNRGVALPAGAATCPGCVISGLSNRVLGIDTYLAY